MKKWISALSAVLLLLGMFGCASAPTAMEYKGESVSVNMYRYWLSTYKGSFLRSYTDVRDTDAFWSSPIYGEVTAETYLTDAVTENVKRNLICAAEFDAMGLKLPEERVAQVDAYIEELITQRAGGSRKVMNQELAVYGINIDMLRQIYLMEDKTDALFTHLYGSGGAHALNAEALEKYCQEKYVRIRHIYVNNAYAYETDAEGHYSYDTSGNLKTRELSAAEIAEKTAKIDAIQTALQSGADFDAVYKQYSEDHYYDNGYYLSATTSFIPDVITAAFQLQVGEQIRVESDYGTHFILRLEMDAKPYENEANGDFFATFKTDAENDHFLTWLDGLLPQVTVAEEEIAPYSIREAVPNYSI